MRLCEQQERHGQLFSKLNRKGFSEGEAVLDPTVSEISHQLWELGFCGFGDRQGSGEGGEGLTGQVPVLRPDHSRALELYLPPSPSP